MTDEANVPRSKKLDPPPHGYGGVEGSVDRPTSDGKEVMTTALGLCPTPAFSIQTTQMPHSN